MKKHIITLGGMPGSGKSSTGKELAKLLGYQRFSSGDFFREMAAKRGISVEEINFRAETEREIDYATDEWIRQKYELENIIMDSRTAFHWMPKAFKVFLKLDPHTAAERTYAQIQSEGRASQKAESVEDVYQNTLKRIDSEKKRYQELYRLDYTDESNYDLVIDTGPNDLRTVTKMITDAYQKWFNQ